MRHSLRVFAGLCAVSLAAMSAPASADYIYTLHDVQFSDGGVANGSFTLNVYGFISTYNVVTTHGALLDGATYASGLGQPATTIDADSDLLTFNLIGYNGFLRLAFAHTLFPVSIDPDPILVGGASFECNSFQLLDESCGPRGLARLVTGGFAIDPPIDVPAPFSIALLGVGLIGLRLSQRVKPAAAETDHAT